MVPHVATFLVDDLECVEWSENFLRIPGGTAVGECPEYDRRLVRNCVVREVTPDVESHVEGSSTVAMQLVESYKNGLQMLATPDVVVVMPDGRTSWLDIPLVTRHNAKIMTSASHSQEKITVARRVDTNGIMDVGAHAKTAAKPG